MASRHDKKRAERFAAAGVGEADLPYAATAYLGENNTECCLCDTPILHLFQLTFHRPLGSVELFPVGSKCIKDWMKAMPESVARSEAIARVKAAEAVMRKQRKLLKQLTEADDEDAANLMRIFFRLPTDAVEAVESLEDIGAKVIRYGSFASDGQRRYFASLVRTAAREHGIDDLRSGRQAPAAPAPAPAPKPAPGADDTERALMARWLALPEEARTEGAMGDIGAKVERFGSFASGKQMGFFKRMLRDAEHDHPPAAVAPSSAPSAPAGAPPPPADEREPNQGPTVEGDLFSGAAEPVAADDTYEDPF